MQMEYKRACPSCGKDIVYVSLDSFRHSKPTTKCRWCCNVLRGKESNRRGCRHSDATKALISVAQKGKKLSMDTRLRMSMAQKKRYSNPTELQKMTLAVTKAMHRPDVRSRHMDALHNSQWLSVKTDNGQMELLAQWNALGYNFQPNYPLRTGTDLFYLDGYDSVKNVVIEYDSKYHRSVGQRKKDSIREQKIIDALQPIEFWRYDSGTKTIKNILEVV